jgi:hypothetical protein
MPGILERNNEPSIGIIKHTIANCAGTVEKKYPRENSYGLNFLQAKEPQF